MAKSKGAHHAEQVKGSIGAITHRVYRGTGTVSKHRAPSRVRMQPASIQTPQEIKDCFSLHSAGSGYTLSSPVSPFYLVSLADQVGGFGILQQPLQTNRPRWYPADPARNNRPYILPDGNNDSIYSTPIIPAYNAPLELWIVAQDVVDPAINRCLFNLHSTASRYLYQAIDPSHTWRWLTPGVEKLAPYGNQTTKIWRICFVGTTLQIFWNGVAQAAPQSLTTFTFNQLRLFSRFDSTLFYNKRLFEIATWRRILNQVEATLLLRYYRSAYNII